MSINCVNNIECYWSRSHGLSATHCLPRVLSDLFLGQCHQLPLLLPLAYTYSPLSATVVALICFISHLNIKICKLLSLKLQINQIRVVFSHLKLWVKVGQGSQGFNILLLLVTINKFSTIFAVQNKLVGLLLFVIYWSIFL